MKHWSLPKQYWSESIGDSSTLLSPRENQIAARSWRGWVGNLGTMHQNLYLTNFLPEASFGLRVLSLPASVCVSVHPCINHELVRLITRHPFKLGSPNLHHRCKRPWLRSLLFWGVIDLDILSRWSQLVGPWEIFIHLLISDFQANSNDWWPRYLLWNCPQMIVTGPWWWKINFASGNGLVPPGSKPLPWLLMTWWYKEPGYHRYGINPSPSGQNGCHFSRWHFQMNFLEWKW